ncbi:hypothetical protein G6F50_015709 [Rhizopus delemar]|uniref:Uncharacterized protein n=1 Tax=Rhizopus delemar TaxID=936053 RepID=A0A9P6XW99_9FUNG|nr:hypothetical protein G6F50_015709 [Rhizopus delemar]
MQGVLTLLQRRQHGLLEGRPVLITAGASGFLPGLLPAKAQPLPLKLRAGREALCTGIAQRTERCKDAAENIQREARKVRALGEYDVAKACSQ